MAPMYLVKRDMEKAKGQSQCCTTADNHTATVTFEDEAEDEDFESLCEFINHHVVAKVVEKAVHNTHDEILDSGSTITLLKNKSSFKN